METTNMTINDSILEQMKSQMAALEKKIANQEIVNERLIQESMKDKMSWIKKYIIMEIALIPVIAFIWAAISLYAGIPLWFTAIIVIGCIIDAYFDWKVNVTPIQENDFDRQNLIETTKKLRKMKTLRYKQTMAGIFSFLLLIVILAVYVYFNNIKGHTFDFTSEHDSVLIGGIVGFFIGTVAGVILVIKVHKKMQRSNDEIISQIEELTHEE